MPDDLDRERLELDRKKHDDETRLAEMRLDLDRAKTGGVSAGTVTLIGAFVALVSAALTAAVGGYWQLQAEQTKSAGQLQIERTRADAEVDRLKRQQQFEILLRATAGVEVETAADNLKFFVEIGYLDDPKGEILAYANRGEAPTIPGPTSNPLLERMRRLREGGAADPTAASDALSKTLQPARAATDFSVVDHILVGLDAMPVAGVPTENYGRLNDRKFVVIHYTGAEAVPAIEWFSKEKARSSAHLVISRDGSVTQLLPFDFASWHAGSGTWRGVTGLNSHTLGISLENLGRLRRVEGRWRTWANAPVPDDQVIMETDGGETGASGWHKYTDAQVETLIGVLKALRVAYPEIEDVLGHNDVSKGRKEDPGPALPMQRVRAEVFGRSEALAPN